MWNTGNCWSQKCEEKIDEATRVGLADLLFKCRIYSCYNNCLKIIYILNVFYPLKIFNILRITNITSCSIVFLAIIMY